MSPLQTFAKEVTEARKEFEAARGRTGWASRWLIFKDAKDAAYEKLVAAIPKVKEIGDFWRYVRNMPTATWLPIIERELSTIGPEAKAPVSPQFVHFLAKCEDEFRRYSGSHSSVEPKLKELERLKKIKAAEPEPETEPEPEARFRCTNIFEDDGAQCRRARERSKRYCERCARIRTLESKRQHIRARRRKNGFVSASA
jgi:hypothetical protein